MVPDRILNQDYFLCLIRVTWCDAFVKKFGAVNDILFVEADIGDGEIMIVGAFCM